MDKYTIDLDKVLNDFEYSELTEESNGYNTVSSNINNQSVYNYPEKIHNNDSLPNAQTYKVPSASTKHSMNNVFHSLNEYLNSDIKDYNNPELSEINEIETRIPSFVSKSQTSIQDIFKDISTDKIVTEITNTSSELEESEYIQHIESNTTLSYVNSKTTVTPALLNTDTKQSLIDCDESIQEEDNEIKNVPLNLIDTDIHIENADPESLEEENVCSNPIFMNTNTTISLSDVKSNRTFMASEPKVSDSYQCLSSSQEATNELITIENENCNTEKEEICETDSKLSDVVDTECELSEKIAKNSDNNVNDINVYVNEVIVKNNEILPDATYSDTEEIDFSSTSKNNTSDIDNNSQTQEINQEIKNDLTKNTNLTQNENKTDDHKSNIEKYDYQLSITENTKVGFQNFDEDLEISDTEMENELKKLEEEYKEKIEIEAKSVDENFETEKTVNIVNDVNEENIVIDVKVDENEVKNIETSQDVEIINDNFKNEDVNNVSTVQNFEIISDNIEDNTNNELKEIENEANANRENFAMLRPNSLDINTETSENAQSNLIGNPGSTPYNNVSVENAITDSPPKSPPKESQQEITNFLSPTLSDVSTSEASDSPNTSDSCNDTSLDDSQKIERALAENNQNETNSSGEGPSAITRNMLGKTAPFWTPDSEAMNCLHCNLKFTVVKRRHHCRACGLVLCSKCCYMKYKLEYMDNQEARVCTKCYDILTNQEESSSGAEGLGEAQGGPARPLNPANPMDYCSVVPPLQQVGNLPVTPPSVMVPVGVLKRKGSGKSRSAKSVMFCDGIRPGCDLTELDYDFNYKASQTSMSKPSTQQTSKTNRNLPKLDTKTNSYIPNEENTLPPTVLNSNILKSEITYSDCANNHSVVEMLKNEKLTFAIQKNLHVHLKVINMDCCINKQAWCFSTEGMIAVGQDEIVILLEFVDNEKTVPKDIFLHLNNIYNEAVKGTSITELGLSIHNTSNLLESKNHAGFLYIKPTFQCIQNIILPKEPYLIGILIHRWETPWAKIFPLRLLLRLGAEYRYYPSPIISTRHRESVYVEIGHTIINLLADFRNFSYTLPNVRGLTIHMKEKNTTVSIPQNRYDQVMKALNNSSDHILAFSANFSATADSHLVCIQDTHGNNENAYTTHAINIHNKPRKVTGASFIVLNGALKSSSGLTAKSSIVEDGLMIQILPEQMVKLRNSLRNMKDFKINCGCVNAQSDEFVNIIWTENDTNFNVGVISPVDNMSLSGVPSIRVHNGKDYVCNSGNKMIRWTEVFIVQSGEENTKTQDPVDISKLSESISKATCQALVKYLDLLAANSFLKVGIRTNLHIENVSYLAGSNGVKLPPIYMKSLDNELIPILHKITSNSLGENAIVIELIFHILNM